MIRKPALAILLFVAALAASGEPADEAPRPGESIYLIVLDQAAAEPDLATLGGRLLRSWSGRRLVALTPDGLAALQRDNAVSYVQRVWTGDAPAPVPAAMPAPPMPAANAAAPAWSTGVYRYDPSGNVTTAGADQYRYDTVGRITFAKVAGQEQSYSYDPYGNLEQLGTADLVVDASTNRLKGGYVYDDAGNVIADAKGRTYHYDALGMLAAINLASTDSALADRRMIYTADDERIVVDDGATTRYRVRDFGHRLLREWKSVGGGTLEWERDYLYAGNDLVAGEVQVPLGKNPLRHYHTDHLGSIRMVTDEARELVARHDYLPFGAELTSTTAEFDNTGKAPRDPRKFTGHERDYFSAANDDSGESVDYMHARYYGSGIGRFLTPDPGKDWDPSQPQSWNLFGYVRNNPVNKTDPTGLWTFSFGISFGGSALGGTVSTKYAIAVDDDGNVALTRSRSWGSAAIISLGHGSADLAVELSNNDTVQDMEGTNAILGGSGHVLLGGTMDVGLHDDGSVASLGGAFGFGGGGEFHAVRESTAVLGSFNTKDVPEAVNGAAQALSTAIYSFLDSAIVRHEHAEQRDNNQPSKYNKYEEHSFFE